MKKYFLDESETIIEKNSGNKYRLLDETDGYKPFGRFQSLKDDDEGTYVLVRGERWYIDPLTWTEISKEDFLLK